MILSNGLPFLSVRKLDLSTTEAFSAVIRNQLLNTPTEAIKQIGHGPPLKRPDFLCSLQHFGGNLNTRDLKAQWFVEYKTTKFP